MAIDDFMDNADDFLTEGALAILLPYHRAKFPSQMAEYDHHELPRAVRMAMTDPRNVDTRYTAFDIVSRQGAIVEKLVIQMGTQTVHRR